MDILYEDKDILVAKKPAGIPVQTKNIAERDMVSEIKNHLSKKTGRPDPYLGIIHRLDRPVQGILVFALNKHAAGELSRQLTGGVFNKRYHAYVEGTVNTGTEWKELTGYLVKDKDTARIAKEGDKNARQAKLKYRTIKTDEESGVTLLDIELITGRFHQIRAQMAGMGHPIAGDLKYGGHRNMPVDGNGIGLCAYSLSFDHPVSGKKLEYSLES